MKDMPTLQPGGLLIDTYLPREDCRDAFISPHLKSIADLPQGAVVGTSSLRRQAQIMARRPDLQIRFLRGNVNTRLAKLDAGEYDAIVLATAGLLRLGFDARIRYPMPPEVSLPAGGQGAVGIECRSSDTELQALLVQLNDEDSALRVRAERALNTRLNGGCQVPIACYAERENGELWLRGLVGDPDGQRMLRAEARGPEAEPEALGIAVAEDLLAQGAQAILDAVYEEAPPR